MTLSPRQSGKFIADIAKHVKINSVKVNYLADLLISEVESGRLSTDNFSQNDVHPKPDNPKAIDWIFVVDTLNFCFWHKETEPVAWQVDGKTGYFALCAAINRAINEKIDILNPKFYSTISEEHLKKILRSDTKTDIPLIQDRVKCLHEAGAVLLEKFEGTFTNVVLESEHHCVKLLQLIVDNFKSYRDSAVYNGQNVSLYKRAQILIGDIWSCFRNKDLGYFEDINEITMFADYRVPQTLLWYGVFEYSKDLIELLEKHTVFENGDEYEVEIRGSSIYAVDLIVKQAKEKLGDKINAILVDHFLWDYRRKIANDILKSVPPFHKVFSVYY